MRIPILFEGQAASGDAWLVEEGTAPPPSAYAVAFTLPIRQFAHLSGCTCCNPRGPVSQALAAMFRARATGTAPFFKRVRVLASAAGQAAIREAVAADVVTVARYVLVP